MDDISPAYDRRQSDGNQPNFPQIILWVEKITTDFSQLN